jgi:hypothetical protein
MPWNKATFPSFNKKKIRLHPRMHTASNTNQNQSSSMNGNGMVHAYSRLGWRARANLEESYP